MPVRGILLPRYPSRLHYYYCTVLHCCCAGQWDNLCKLSAAVNVVCIGKKHFGLLRQQAGDLLLHSLSGWERGRDQVAGRLDIAAMLFANPEGHKHLSWRSLSLLWHCGQLLDCFRCLLVCIKSALVLRNKKQLMRILDISCSALVGDFKYKLHRFLFWGLMFHGKCQSENYKETQQADLLVLKRRNLGECTLKFLVRGRKNDICFDSHPCQL